MNPAEKPEKYYTKDEVNMLIQAAVAEAHEMDRKIMAKHNRDATIISAILGFLCLALFLDGLLRILGIVPPFIEGWDVSILDDVVERVESDVIPLLQKYAPNLPGI